MKNGKKILLAGAFSLAVFFITLWAILSTPEPPSLDEAPHVMRSDGNFLQLEKNGRKIFELTAVAIETDLAAKNAKAQNIEGTFYQEDGRKLKIKAPHAVYDLKAQDLQLNGGVAIETTDGITLTSREVIWQNEKVMLSAIGDVKLQKDAEKLRVTAERIDTTDGFAKFTAYGANSKKARIAKGVE